MRTSTLSSIAISLFALLSITSLSAQHTQEVLTAEVAKSSSSPLIDFPDIKTMTNKASMEEAEAYLSDTEWMKGQIRSHIQQNLAYDEILKESRIEGRVILALEIDSQGKLINLSITSSLSPEADRLALKSLQDFTAIDRAYLGASRFMIPVDFKLQ